jgi:hypothetical protein
LEFLSYFNYFILATLFDRQTLKLPEEFSKVCPTSIRIYNGWEGIIYRLQRKREKKAIIHRTLHAKKCDGEIY